MKVCFSARYEHSNSIELENQPPRSSAVKRRSLFVHHQSQQEQDLLSSTWDNLRSSNQYPLCFNDLHRPLTATTAASYHRTNSAPNREQNFPEHFSPLLTEHHHSSIFHENSLIRSNPKSKIHFCLLS